jgi:hypothetical protein
MAHLARGGWRGAAILGIGLVSATVALADDGGKFGKPNEPNPGPRW